MGGEPLIQKLCHTQSINICVVPLCFKVHFKLKKPLSHPFYIYILPNESFRSLGFYGVNNFLFWFTSSFGCIHLLKGGHQLLVCLPMLQNHLLQQLDHISHGPQTQQNFKQNWVISLFQFCPSHFFNHLHYVFYFSLNHHFFFNIFFQSTSPQPFLKENISKLFLA